MSAVWPCRSDRPSSPALREASQLRARLPSVRSSQLQEVTRLARQPPRAQESSVSSSLSLWRRESKTVLSCGVWTVGSSQNRVVAHPRSLRLHVPLSRLQLVLWPPC